MTRSLRIGGNWSCCLWLFSIFGARMSADEVRSAVIAGVCMLDASQLEDCCEKLTLTVEADKKGKKTALECIIMRHLCSETLVGSEDEGMGVFLMLHDHMKTLLGAKSAKTVD